MFISLLSGDSLDWVAALPADTRTTMDRMILAFTEKYIQRDLFSRENDASAFYSIQQTANQSIREYAAALRQLAAKLQLPDDQLTQKLWASVRPEIKHRCALVTRPAEWDQAVSLLQQAERTVQSSTAALLMSAVVPEQAPTAATETPLLAAIATLTDKIGTLQMEHGSRRPTQPQPPRRRQPLTCWYCGKVGHVRRDCRQLYFSNARGYATNNREARQPQGQYRNQHAEHNQSPRAAMPLLERADLQQEGEN